MLFITFVAFIHDDFQQARSTEKLCKEFQELMRKSVFYNKYNVFQEVTWTEIHSQEYVVGNSRALLLGDQMGSYGSRN